MNQRLRVTLPPDWALEPGGADAPYTFTWRDDRAVGALQFSLGRYKSGKVPNPSRSDLEQMAFAFGADHNWPRPISQGSGACTFGQFGLAVFQSVDFSRIQLWFLSNGRDFIMVTHTCEGNPLQDEIEAANQIVLNATLSTATPKRPWWRLGVGRA